MLETNFFLNGQHYFTNSELTISQVIKYFDYNISLFVLEYNNLILNKKNWSNIFIKNDDTIEIVTIVGGG